MALTIDQKKLLLLILDRHPLAPTESIHAHTIIKESAPRLHWTHEKVFKVYEQLKFAGVIHPAPAHRPLP